MATQVRDPKGSDRGPDGKVRKASRTRPVRALVILAVAASMLVPVIGAEAAPQKLGFTATPTHQTKDDSSHRGPRSRPTPTPTPTAAPTTTPTPTATAPAPASTADPTATPTADPTATPTAAPTATAAPTPTATPTATPTPTPTPTPVVNPPAAVTSFVTTCGTALCLDSAPYRFTGLSIYNANSRNNCWYSLGFSDGALSGTLDQIGTGMEAFRAWFYQGLAGTPGARDWTAFDHTLAVARAKGVRVIVSLSGEGGDCKDYPVDTRKTESWYATGYKAPEASGESYLAWVREVVTRYRNDPSILAWQMMGEAEDPADASGTCLSTANDTLKAWADTTSAAIKAIDTNHLVTVGVIGSGQCGASGTAYQGLHSSPNIDVCTREDYDDPTSLIPGDRWNGMQVRIDECHALGKPIFVSESGLHRTVTNRAASVDAKWSAQFSAGMVGELLWDWSNGPISDNYEITPGDAILPLLAKY